MGKGKLEKFAQMEEFNHVFQYPYGKLQNEGFPFRGKWNREVFKNDHPIVLELGCGKGEYTVQLAQQYPCCNFIGIDIKGARMWSGAKASQEMGNVAFLRTNIELIDHFFAPKEVQEIWITFPDPQMKKASKRLTSTRFMQLYLKILNENPIINLKTDSPFLYGYTKAMVEENGLEILKQTDDLYNEFKDDPLLNIRTFYEQQWLDRGLTIKYIQFILKALDEWKEPDIELEKDDYRSYNRSKRSHMVSQKNI